MIRKVHYKAIDPEYDDVDMTFVGVDDDDIDEQEYEFESFLGRDNIAGIRFIFHVEVKES
jgi:hypothetical protein